VFATFNPTPNWPQDWFWTPYQNGTLKAPYAFIPATARDNPFIPEAVWESWKNLPDEEYKRFVEGEWTFLDDPDQLIKGEWIAAARNVAVEPGPRRYAVDVARFGDDMTTTAETHGNALIRLQEYSGLSVDRVVDTVAIDMHLLDKLTRSIDSLRVDGVGLGAGVVDGLRRKGFDVVDVIAGAKPIERKDSFFRFDNLRSQMWWEYREKLRLRQISYPIDLPPKLVKDLTAIRYTINADKVISVESKKDIKKRIGRSTDYGDSVVMAELDLPPPPKRPRLPGTIVQSTYA
jgi:hypothetical protein